MASDSLQKFMFDQAPVRGELVEVPETWKHILARRDYPQPVKTVLGQMLAAAALLSANLKFDGTVIMQIHGDGPVRLLVVECDSSLQMRATAKVSEDAQIDGQAGLQDLVNTRGHGRFIITLDPKDKLPGKLPYQGIVPLDGDTLATVIENYMWRSEQLETRLWLAADDQVARGLLLQKMPVEGGVHAAHDPQTMDHDGWDRAVSLASTLNAEELLSTDIETLLHRLFWEETIRVFDPKHPHFHCSCTREKVGGMLKMLGREEVDAALADLESLQIDCDFCGQHYAFDKVDCAQLFATETPLAAQQAASRVKH